ncbi:hypothetical protein H9639_01550 [Arthrobacter sp. Sa2CUA1]|uniref:Uncharacterized protein n=1 Tax=Arthrobacter gallicola TaxID=2762225 RepID=A0ABR8UN54_9MICC|nr:hypothetical protein [Arthrobacter gallicola]MBD7993983.1 hypothetical protein [Arthrobacter gallicola]
MREFVKLPRWAWGMVGSLTGWLIGMGILRLVKGDAPLPVSLLLLLSGTALLGFAYIHRAQGQSPQRLAEKRSAEVEKRWEQEAYQRELEDRRREYEAHLRRSRQHPGGGSP